jgi:hypothetical protein
VIRKPGGEALREGLLHLLLSAPTHEGGALLQNHFSLLAARHSDALRIGQLEADRRHLETAWHETKRKLRRSRARLRFCLALVFALLVLCAALTWLSLGA